jgi:NAD+ kinase
VVRDSKIPIVGINSGRLGFLASISREEDIDMAVEALLIRATLDVEKRSLLELAFSGRGIRGVPVCPERIQSCRKKTLQ